MDRLSQCQEELDEFVTARQRRGEWQTVLLYSEVQQEAIKDGCTDLSRLLQHACQTVHFSLHKWSPCVAPWSLRINITVLTVNLATDLSLTIAKPHCINTE